MATSSVGFKSRLDHRKQLELEEARKAGIVPAEVDEDGKEINPHIPKYMSTAPWYLSAEKPRKQKLDSNTKAWYDRGAKTFQATIYRKGACENCGAMTHNAKLCLERPRKVGAKWTDEDIAPDEKIEIIELDYDGKHDRWNGYDVENYAYVIDRFEARDESRKRYLKQQHLKRSKEKSNQQNGGCGTSNDDDLKADESKVEFAKVQKRVRRAGGGSTGTVRNLRIREDTAKYLLNLDVNSAYYDPKARSMREDPLPDMDPNDKVYSGDNQNRINGQASEFRSLNLLTFSAFERGYDVHMQAAPSQAESLYKNCKDSTEKLKAQTEQSLGEKYGINKI